MSVAVAVAASGVAAGQSDTLLDRFLLFVLAEEQLKVHSRLAYGSLVRSVGTVTKPDSVRRVQERLERVMGRKLTINVLNDRSFNASAYPSGEMFINIGAVESLHNDEDMIAAILGHEIAHVQRQHSLKQFQNQLLVNTVVAGLLSSGDLEALAPYLAAAITSRYGRDQELEADRFGFVYAVRAGYSPTGPQRSFQTMSELEGRSTVGLFDSHPPSAYRARQLEKMAQAYDDGVPLDWIQAGKLTNELYREIGSPPDVIVAESVFMSIMMNLPGSVFTKDDYPRFTITPNVDGHLAILKISPDGTVGQLLPNPYDKFGLCKIGEPIDVPSTEYRTAKGELVRLRWDSVGTFRYLFVVTEGRVDFGSLLGTKHDLASLTGAVADAAREQRVLLIDTAETTISVAGKATDVGGHHCEHTS